MDKKPWYEKVNIWIGIIASVFSILGISILSNKSLINGKNTEMENISDINSDENNMYPESSLYIDNDSPQQTESEDNLLSEQIENESDKFTEELASENIVEPFITSQPKSDSITCANWYDWTENDRDIIGNTYSSPTAIKVSIYNTINAISGGSHDISADLHIPLGEKYSGPWKLNFVVAKEMIGNGSYANIKILSGEEELVPEFTIESITTDEIIHEITLDGIRDLVIHFDCHAVDNGFWVGIICE